MNTASVFDALPFGRKRMPSQLTSPCVPAKPYTSVNFADSGVLHMHPFGCNDEAHLLWTQSAWCGAFLVLVHSCSISLLTEASFFFMDGVVVSTASSSRWPFGSKK